MIRSHNLLSRPKPGRVLLALIVLIAGISGCTAVLPRSGVQGSRTYHRALEMTANGFPRTYRVHVPRGYDPQRVYAMVIVIHGAFGSAEAIETETGFSDLADRENFVAVYPNGMGLYGWLQHWNAGHCCGKAAADGIDDVGFFEAVIDDVVQRLRIDEHRVYMIGFSNGGMLAYRFAAERTERLAAMAALSAAMGGRPDPETPEWRIGPPSRPLPVLILHSPKDESIPYDGGHSGRRPDDPRTYTAVAEAAAFWAGHNGCGPAAEARPLYRGQVLKKVWQPCSGGSEVVLYTLTDWPHIWPGPAFYGDLPDDHPLRDFDAATVAWAFFKKHRRE